MTTAENVLRALEPFNLKAEGQGKYRSNSPFRPGSDSMGFTLTIAPDGEHGAFKDWPANDDGSLYELARRLNVELPIIAPAADTKRAYTGFDDYATRHGAPTEAFRKAGWDTVMKDNRPALSIPTDTGMRYRFLDDRKPVYKSQPGYQRCLYGVNALFFARVVEGQPIVFCNGEASTVVGQHHGLAAFCVTAGENEIPATILESLIAGLGEIRPPVLIALDCDDKGRSTALAVKPQFEKAGFTARAVDLGLGHGGDLADFCLLYAGNVPQSLLARPDLTTDNSPPDDPYQFQTIDDVLSQPPIEWLVKDIIPRQALCMVFGPSGTLKTFLVLQIAYGLSFIERVVFVVAEGYPGMRQRVEALMKFNGGKKPPYLTFVDGTIDLFNQGAVERFISRLEAYKPALLIVDTFANSAGDADENKGRDMNRILTNLEQIKRAMGTTVLLVHHTNKGGRQERGHGSLYARCDTVIRLSRLDDVTVVESQKSKDSQGFETYSLRELVIPLGYKNSDGDEVTSLVLLPAGSVVPTPDSLTPKQRAAMDAIQVNDSISLNDLADVIEASNKQEAYRVVKTLTGRGLVFRDAAGKLNLTPAGEKVLAIEPDEQNVRNVTAVTTRQETLKGDGFLPHSVTPVTASQCDGKGELFDMGKDSYYRAGA